MQVLNEDSHSPLWKIWNTNQVSEDKFHFLSHHTTLLLPSRKISSRSVTHPFSVHGPLQFSLNPVSQSIFSFSHQGRNQIRSKQDSSWAISWCLKTEAGFYYDVRNTNVYQVTTGEYFGILWKSHGCLQSSAPHFNHYHPSWILMLRNAITFSTDVHLFVSK